MYTAFKKKDDILTSERINTFLVAYALLWQQITQFELRK